MLQIWGIAGIAIVYLAVLFAIAYIRDKISDRKTSTTGRPTVYALSLAIYCTSWTFFGSVGLAAEFGFEFLTIYIGPIIFILFFNKTFRRIISLAKSERVTSIADFIASRYGKSQGVAAVVTIIALIGTIPYIALQIKAISLSVVTILSTSDLEYNSVNIGNFTILILIALAVFVVLFSTRRIEASEHREGLLFAVATESIVKLIAFLAVGTFVVLYHFGNPTTFFSIMATNQEIKRILMQSSDISRLFAFTLLSFSVFIILPRMFHVAVTENRDTSEINRATWLFPVYLVLINLLVIPIAFTGLLTFNDLVSADIYVLALPLFNHSSFFTLLAFIGGFSAATAMVIVATVALSIMISNAIVMPLVLRGYNSGKMEWKDMGTFLLNTRRISIFLTILLAYAYYRMANENVALASIGIIAFIAISQCAPSFFGGLIWRRGNARGAILGMVSGIFVWFCLLLLPTIAESGLLPFVSLELDITEFWRKLSLDLIGLDSNPLENGFFASLVVNILFYIFGSLSRRSNSIEQAQANVFVPSINSTSAIHDQFNTKIAVGELKNTVARFLGIEQAEISFNHYFKERRIRGQLRDVADAYTIQYAEQLLSSAIGPSSSRLVLSLQFKKSSVSKSDAMELLDEASIAIKYNRDLLQTAFDQVKQGIGVFDSKSQLTAWNRQFQHLLNLPVEFFNVGLPLESIIHQVAEQGEFGTGPIQRIVAEKLKLYAVETGTFQETMHNKGTVIEVQISPMPSGGMVVTYDDITDRVAAQKAVVAANESLERRVQERTEELTHVNSELIQAKKEADTANIGKTRFLAAVGHDILQPLHAARLFVASMTDQTGRKKNQEMINNIEASLESVEEIISAILDISRLDTGKMQISVSEFPILEILNPLKSEFDAVAMEKQLDFTMVPTKAWVRSDKKLLRRLLQNLISNAMKYTQQGRVLVGCRYKGSKLHVEIHDTGIGLPPEQQRLIFHEFKRLEEGIKTARGLGLGLSIVERISHVLDHRIFVESQLGIGTKFSVELPITAVLFEQKTNQVPTEVDSSLTGLIVLVIDNETSILRAMQTLLENWNCEVLTACSQEDAEKVLENYKFSPHVVLVDYHLNEGNGLDVMSFLRWRFGENLPAILITADHSSEVHNQAQKLQIDVLTKPVNPDKLIAKLSQYLIHEQSAE